MKSLNQFINEDKLNDILIYEYSYGNIGDKNSQLFAIKDTEESIKSFAKFLFREEQLSDDKLLKKINDIKNDSISLSEFVNNIVKNMNNETYFDITKI